ncbi:hypothetical protein GQ44DRAFT_729752 [Phaeosphaeriaceae sp. PMI808]|nr:hypothetical protein GQ44DRAFT_729752 [Phaeosphaeriaceae sp. PMI808]
MRSYKREIDHFKRRAERCNGTTRYKRLLKAASAMADLRAVAERELSRITAAATARKNRQNASQKQVQRGGVLTAAEARAAVDARVESESQKVARKAARQYKADQQRLADARADELRAQNRVTDS